MRDVRVRPQLQRMLVGIHRLFISPVSMMNGPDIGGRLRVWTPLQGGLVVAKGFVVVPEVVLHDPELLVTEKIIRLQLDDLGERRDGVGVSACLQQARPECAVRPQNAGRSAIARLNSATASSIWPSWESTCPSWRLASSKLGCTASACRSSSAASFSFPVPASVTASVDRMAGSSASSRSAVKPSSVAFCAHTGSRDSTSCYECTFRRVRRAPAQSANQVWWPS